MGRTTARIAAWALGLGVVLALAGCEQHTYPVQVEVTTAVVTGNVQLVVAGGAAQPQGNVTVRLTGNSGTYEGVSHANGAYTINDVPAPGTYAVTLRMAANLRATALGNVQLVAEEEEHEVPTIYVTEAPPVEPGL